MESTYNNEAIDSGPHGIVGQLPPASLVHYRPLVDATTDKVDQDGDDDDHAEHTAGS